MAKAPEYVKLRGMSKAVIDEVEKLNNIGIPFGQHSEKQTYSKECRFTLIGIKVKEWWDKK